jgi:hypothetical protein
LKTEKLLSTQHHAPRFVHCVPTRSTQLRLFLACMSPER